MQRKEKGVDDDAYSWDDDNAEKNLEKHKLDFPLVRKIFADNDRIEGDDTSSSFSEDRFFCIGAIGFAVYHVTSAILPDGRARIISLRPASKRETNDYHRSKSAR